MTLNVLLITIATLLFLDAFRRKGSLTRPEFYLFVSVYAYGTGGYVFHNFLKFERYNFILDYSQSQLNFGYALVIVTLMAIYYGGKLYRPIKIEINRRPRQSIVLVSVFACFGAIIYAEFVLQYSGLGTEGFRHHDYVAAKSQLTLLPFGPLFIMGISFFALHEKGQKSWMLWLLFALVMAQVGSRRLALMSFFAILIAKSHNGIRPVVIPKRILVVIFACLLAVGMVIGATRGAVTMRTLNIANSINGISEYGRTFASLMFYTTHDFEYQYGKTLLTPLLILPPDCIQPYKNPKKPGRLFLEAFYPHSKYTRFPPGLGFSVIAEVIVNFSIYSIPLFFFLLSRLICRIRVYFANRNMLYMNSALAVACYTTGRSGLSGPVIFILTTIAISFMIVFTGQVIRNSSVNIKDASKDSFR